MASDARPDGKSRLRIATFVTGEGRDCLHNTSFEGIAGLGEAQCHFPVSDECCASIH
jgi:hypothetical protein